MVDDQSAAGSGFNPGAVLRRARRGRSAKEKFDAFSDAYIWAIALGIALAYGFGFLRAGLGAIVGEFAAATVLPSAVLPVSEVLFSAVVFVFVWILRLLLRLGPAAVTEPQSFWWMTLPIDQWVLRRRAGVKAALIAVVVSFSAWVLWYFLMATVVPVTHWLIPVGGALGAVLAGVVLAELAVIVQHRAAVRCTRGLLNLTLWLVLLYCVGQWVLRMFGLIHPEDQLLVSVFWEPWAFLGVLLVLAVALLALGPAARTALQGLEPKSLRSAGRRQHSVHAALFMMDAQALRQAEISRPKRRAKRGAGGSGGRWPVVLELVGKRMLRSGLLRTSLLTLLLFAAVLLLVRDAANPVSLAGLWLVLLIQMMLALSDGFEPLLSNAAWRRNLGLGEKHILVGMRYAVLVPGMLLAGLGAGVAGLLFEPLGMLSLLPAVLLAGCGVVAGVRGRTGSWRADLAVAIEGIGTTAGALSMLARVFGGVGPTVISALPLLSLLVGATPQTPWVLWVVAVIAARRGIDVLIPRLATP